MTFKGWTVALALLAPQLAITFIFFVWPASQALYQAGFIADPFGLKSQFVGLDNFKFILSDSYYRSSFITTGIFSISVAALSMGFALPLAVLADRGLKGAIAYRTLLIWPYAVAPAIAAVLFMFMFQPSIGLFPWYLKMFGYDWNHVLNGREAMLLVVLASAWKQISYNFLFFLAGLQAVPRSLIEASAIDGAGPWHRFWTIILPLLSPTVFFLLVVNLVYAFFETFSVIHLMTSGGPGQSTMILVYKVFSDGFVGQDLGSSSAQSVILIFAVGLLTFVQFRYLEKRVHYQP